MFPKYFSFYLTVLFKFLGKIWFIYYLYPNDVIVTKNDAKVSYSIFLLEIAEQKEIKYCFSSNISSLQTICSKYFVNARDFVVAMVTN